MEVPVQMISYPIHHNSSVWDSQRHGWSSLAWPTLCEFFVRVIDVLCQPLTPGRTPVDETDPINRISVMSRLGFIASVGALGFVVSVSLAAPALDRATRPSGSGVISSPVPEEVRMLLAPRLRTV
jgi:hypothetical protein